MEASEEKKLQWHTAFQAALQIELDADAEFLHYTEEYMLSKMPLKIDILILKEQMDRAINKSIGKLFRRYNVIEYKSPDDYVSINDFHHVMAYACLYLSETVRVNERESGALTISFMCYHYPRKLIRHLKREHHITIDKYSTGIWYVSGLMFPVQIIQINKLPPEVYGWLSRLRSGLKQKEDIEPLVTAYKGKEKQPLYETLMDIIVRANIIQFEEGQVMCNALRELFADEFKVRENQAMQVGLEQGLERGKIELLKQLIDKKQKKGKSAERIAEELELSVTAVMKLMESTSLTI